MFIGGQVLGQKRQHIHQLHAQHHNSVIMLACNTFIVLLPTPTMIDVLLLGGVVCHRSCTEHYGPDYFWGVQLSGCFIIDSVYIFA
jgi:hypothetical protein